MHVEHKELSEPGKVLAVDVPLRLFRVYFHVCIRGEFVLSVRYLQAPSIDEAREKIKNLILANQAQLNSRGFHFKSIEEEPVPMFEDYLVSIGGSA